MTKVVHLIDEHSPCDALEQLSLLRWPAEEVVSVGPPPRGCPVRPATSLHRPMGSSSLAGWRAPAEVESAELLHAWSIGAAQAARMVAARTGRRVLLSLPAYGPWAGLPQCLEDREIFFAVPTQAARDAMLEAGTPSHRVHILPPPAGAAEVSPDRRAAVRAELGLQDGQMLVAAPGEMTRESGHKCAPWAHAILRQIRPDLRLILPGGGPRERSVRFFVDSAGVAEEVFLTGERYSLPDVLAAADVAAFFHERDCGVWTLATAMAACLPVVASRTPDIAECAPDGEAAVLVRPGDPREAAAGLLKAMDDEALRQRLGRAAKERARNLFHVAACRSRLDEIYAAVRI